jgi:hypothetical protein
MLHSAGAATSTIRFVGQSSDEFGNRLEDSLIDIFLRLVAPL